MVSFAELKDEKEFVKLHGNRQAILSCLLNVEAALDNLPTDKPSIRAFSKLEKEIEEEVVQLTVIDKKITAWYVGQGGLRNDSSYTEYNLVKTKLLSKLAAKQDTYHELLKGGLSCFLSIFDTFTLKPFLKVFHATFVKGP